MVKATAPGKLMLMGDHAVIYDRPCLVTSVGIYLSVDVTSADSDTLHIQASTAAEPVQIATDDLTDGVPSDFPKEVRFVVAAVQRVYEAYHLDSGLHITTAGPDLSYGLGSSSAVTVATVAALGAHFDLTLSRREIFDLAYGAVLDVQGKGSGFDVAAATYGGTLYYVTGGTTIEPLDVPELPLLIGYSGFKVSTVNLVDEVRRLHEQFPAAVDGVFDAMAALTDDSRTTLQAGDWRRFGQAANLHQGLLDTLGTSTPGLDRLMYRARGAGAYGAKLSGAGGGDCMFAVADEAALESVTEAMQTACERINQSVEQAAAQLVTLETGVAGVQIESS
jgi:mevalonate kinase